MPELPEVETIRRGLELLVVGQQINSVEVLLPKMFIGSAEDIVGASLVSAGRRGKLLIIRTSGTFSVLIHLKMTGQLLFVRAGETTSLPEKSTKVIFTFESGDRLFFNDFRTFGFVQLFEQTKLDEHPFIRKIGIEPLENFFTQSSFYALLSKSNRSNIKAFLLDQTKIAGLGNIYADEVLFAAKILPTRRVDSLSFSERELLFESIRAVLSKGIDLRGSSHTSYVDVSGERGVFLNQATVYQRAGLPCRDCGTLITKIRLAGRGTHYCPNCQK